VCRVIKSIYTHSSRHAGSTQVMVMLDNLYGKFDDLVKKHDLFKVETIGDAYMCVGNLRSRQPDHAHRIARFAMDAVDAASETLGASLRCV
jgi:guanylate cyclase